MKIDDHSHNNKSRYNVIKVNWTFGKEVIQISWNKYSGCSDR